MWKEWKRCKKWEGRTCGEAIRVSAGGRKRKAMGIKNKRGKDKNDSKKNEGSKGYR